MDAYPDVHGSNVVVKHDIRLHFSLSHAIDEQRVGVNSSSSSFKCPVPSTIVERVVEHLRPSAHIPQHTATALTFSSFSISRTLSLAVTSFCSAMTTCPAMSFPDTPVLLSARSVDERVTHTLARLCYTPPSQLSPIDQFPALFVECLRGHSWSLHSPALAIAVCQPRWES